MFKIFIYKISYKELYYFVVFIYLIFVFSVIILSKPLFGLRFFTNVSSSMNPLINTESITVVKPQNSYSIGDIITFYTLSKNSEIRTHRVYSVSGNVYLTKGDANTAIDNNIVLPRLVIGKVILVVPVLGYLYSFTKTPIGIFLFIVLPAVCICFTEINNILKNTTRLTNYPFK